MFLGYRNFPFAHRLKSNADGQLEVRVSRHARSNTLKKDAAKKDRVKSIRDDRSLRTGKLVIWSTGGFVVGKANKSIMLHPGDLLIDGANEDVELAMRLLPSLLHGLDFRAASANGVPSTYNLGRRLPDLLALYCLSLDLTAMVVRA